MGGWVWPPPYGLGRMLRGGTLKYVPSNSYASDDHIFLNSQTTSSHGSLVVAVSRWNVPTSQDPAPRPVPNSKRPSDTWSSIATRSASRTGWLTIGFRLK